MDLLEGKEWYEEDKDDSNDKARVILFSFNLEILKQFKELVSEILRVLLLSEGMMNKRVEEMAEC